MYGKAIRFASNKNVGISTITRVCPSSFFSSGSTHPHNMDSKFADDVRKSVSGLAPPSGTRSGDHVKIVKTSTSRPSSTTHDHMDKDGDSDTGSYVADTAKQGVAKAMETGLNIGEKAKQTLDNMWDATKDTTHKVKEAVTKNDEDKNDVPSTDQFVDDLRKRADGYDLRKK